jgi:ribonuclease HI
VSSRPPAIGERDLAEFQARMEELRSSLTPPTAEAEFEVNTDGGCIGNPGSGGWAAVVDQGDRRWELWGRLSSTTNNRAEALGVLAAVDWLPARARVVLSADSKLTLNQLDGTWKVRKNAEIWEEIRRLIASKQLQLRTRWVPGHAGVPGNERADSLANAAARNSPPPPPGEVVRTRSSPPPAELEGLQPTNTWEADFLRSVASQLRAGRALSDKQRAVLDRMRARPSA